jgi:hypothetical protein
MIAYRSLAHRCREQFGRIGKVRPVSAIRARRISSPKSQTLIGASRAGRRIAKSAAARDPDMLDLLGRI